MAKKMETTAAKAGKPKETNTLLRETVRASFADLTRSSPRDRTADDLTDAQKAALAKAWSVDGDGIYAYNAYSEPKGGFDTNAFSIGYWTNKDPNHQVEKLFGRGAASWTKDGDLEFNDTFDLDFGKVNLPGVPTNADPEDVKIKSRISAKALGLDPKVLWETSNSRLRGQWDKYAPALARIQEEVSAGTFEPTTATDSVLRGARALRSRYDRINSGPYRPPADNPIGAWKDPFVKAAEDFDAWFAGQPSVKVSTRQAAKAGDAGSPANRVSSASGTAPEQTYDTPIPDSLRPAYERWYAQLPKNLQYTGDYDLQGAWLERLGRPEKYEATQNGHLDDYGKKPNHPTFSSGSKWHDPKVPERTGGEWKRADDGSWDFYPGSGNRLTDEQLAEYFRKYEKGSRVHPRNVRQAAKAGDAGSSSSTGAPKGSNPALEGYAGPRIVVNPKVFKDSRDALCVAFDEAFRIVMEVNGFDPVAEPTERQRRFFADTAYSGDERMMRRTILARLCTFDTSVEDPTDEQLQEAVEFLDTVMEIGAPQNQWEQRAVQRIRDAIAAAVGQPREGREGRAEPPSPPDGGSVEAAEGGGEADDKTLAQPQGEQPQGEQPQGGRPYKGVFSERLGKAGAIYDESGRLIGYGGTEDSVEKTGVSKDFDTWRPDRAHEVTSKPDGFYGAKAVKPLSGAPKETEEDRMARLEDEYHKAQAEAAGAVGPGFGRNEEKNAAAQKAADEFLKAHPELKEHLETPKKEAEAQNAGAPAPAPGGVAPVPVAVQKASGLALGPKEVVVGQPDGGNAERGKKDAGRRRKNVAVVGGRYMVDGRVVTKRAYDQAVRENEGI